MDWLLQVLTVFDRWLWGNWLLFVLLGVGSGNIVGVSTAVVAGGMGALFWMWVAAFLGMATKYGEIVLGMLYREKDETGAWTGGPMYYIEKGLHAPWLAALCAGFMVVQIIGGNLIQSNTVSGLVKECFRIPFWVTGGVLVAVIFLVSTGGLKGLAQVSQRLVPAMAVLYAAGGVLILLANITRIPGVIRDIFAGAFGLRAAAGGALGSMMAAMEKGIARGLYSNEAGEGYLLVAEAFASVWKPLGYVVSLSLILFCVTTLMSQWYFGYVGLNYLWGRRVAGKFRYIFPVFCMAGALLEMELVWTIQDIALGLLTIPNLCALAVLWPEVGQATKEYFGEEQK